MITMRPRFRSIALAAAAILVSVVSAARADIGELRVYSPVTETGEYWANFGLLVEYERVAHRQTDTDEFAIGPMIERDIGQTTTDLNLLLTRQLGPNIEQRGVGLRYALQTRWRLLPEFQPAL